MHLLPIALGEKPFPPVDKFRLVWQDIFKNPKCLTDHHDLVRDAWWPASLSDELKFSISNEHLFPIECPSSLRTLVRDRRWASHLPPNLVRFLKGCLPELFASKPFVRNLGALCFNARTTCLTNQSERQNLANFLASRGKLPERFQPPSIFGYDAKLGDQRMNFVCFEVYKPVNLSASMKDGALAKGKIRVHIYPSGYVILRVEISINHHSFYEEAWGEGRQILRKLLIETRPWRSNSSIVWCSKFGRGKMTDILEQVKNNLRESILQDSSLRLREGRWQTTLRLFTNYNCRKTAAELLSIKGQYETMDVADHWGANKYLLASRQGLACLFGLKQGRKSARNFFLMFSALAEFVAFKQMVYSDYIHFLNEQIIELTDYRLSLKRKLVREDLFRFSVYDSTVHWFLGILDRHINAARPFHRRIYSLISNGTGFDEKRDKVKELAKSWHQEVSQWEPSLAKLWKKVIWPLRSLLISK